MNHVLYSTVSELVFLNLYKPSNLIQAEKYKLFYIIASFYWRRRLMSVLIQGCLTDDILGLEGIKSKHLRHSSLKMSHKS